MSNKIVAKTLLCLTVIFSAADFAAAESPSETALLQRLEKLESQVKRQAQKIEELENDLRRERGLEDEEPAGFEETDFGMPEFKEIGPVTEFRPHLEGLAWDNRLKVGYRSQKYRRFVESSETELSSFFSKLQLGAVWDTHESWEVGVSAVAGWSRRLSPSAGLETAQNRLYADGWPFDSGSVDVDLAYVRHSYDTARLTLGSQPNPFRSSETLWAPAVRPAGISAEYEFEGAFVAAGWYDSFRRPLKNVPDVSMWGVQAGYENGWQNLDYTVAAAFYRFSRTGELLPGNSSKRAVSSPDIGAADIYTAAESEIGEVRVLGEAQMWHNLRSSGGSSSQAPETADSGGQRTGLSLGLTGKWRNALLGYTYSRVEADSFAWPLTDEYTLINQTGHQLQAGYDFTEHWQLRLQYFYGRQIRGSGRTEAVEASMLYRF